jgi:hypothetical protein
MNRRLALSIAVFALLSARRASAQSGAQDVSIGYQGLPYKATGENPTGINLAEGVLMHVGAGAEAGWDSNVFYSSSKAQSAVPVISSGILRFTGYGEITNATRQGAAPALSYDLRAGLTYRRYTDSNDNVQKYNNAFMPTAGLSLATTSGTWSFQLADTFLRTEDPPYLGSIAAPISRDNNLASVQAQWAPGGGRITGTLRYLNALDIFENNNFNYANSVSHTFMLDVSWKWLPKTALFVQATQGYVTYLNTQNPAPGNAAKVPSYPLHIIGGLRGLITPKLTAVASLGYANAFYSSGATTSGFLGSSYVDLQAIVTPTLLSRITVGYHQDFQNSVISNFYYAYSVYGSYVQQIAGRLSFDLSGRYGYLNYQGLLFDMGRTRIDNSVIVGATLDYFIRNWIYAGVGYALIANFSDYLLPDPMGNPDPTRPVDYVKHQVFARLGVTY